MTLDEAYDAVLAALFAYRDSMTYDERVAGDGFFVGRRTGEPRIILFGGEYVYEVTVSKA